MVAVLASLALISQNNGVCVQGVMLNSLVKGMDQHQSSKILKYTDDFNYFYNLEQQSSSSLAAASSANEEV